MKTITLLLLLLGAATASAGTSKLPMVEVPTTSGTSDTLVVFVSGDGGWAAIDREVSRVLAANGMPVAGLNALQYFWTRRTPDSAAGDLQAIITDYTSRWHRPRVLLIGYSRGADVLPAMINRMPAAIQSKIRLIVLLGPSPKVEFEFHVADWLRNGTGGMAVKPEIDRLASHRILCVGGEDDPESLCRQLTGRPNIDVVTLKGAHHFDGGYSNLGHLILERLQ